MMNMTEGYSASDLKNLTKDAIMMPVRELSTCKWWKNTPDGKIV